MGRVRVSLGSVPCGLYVDRLHPAMQNLSAPIRCTANNTCRGLSPSSGRTTDILPAIVVGNKRGPDCPFPVCRTAAVYFFFVAPKSIIRLPVFANMICRRHCDKAWCTIIVNKTGYRISWLLRAGPYADLHAVKPAPKIQHSSLNTCSSAPL